MFMPRIVTFNFNHRTFFVLLLMCLTFLAGNQAAMADDLADTRFAQKICEEKWDTFGCLNLIRTLRAKISPPESTRVAALMYRKACGEGNGYGCFKLAKALSQGRGVDRNFNLAAEIYEISCEIGTMEACVNLGAHHAKGRGVKKSDQEARIYYKMACEGHEGYGCLNLGHIYFSGRGVRRDGAKAHGLYKKACKSGVAQGCYETYVKFETKYPANEIDQAKRRYFRSVTEACNAGGSKICYRAGVLSRYGLGTEKNLSEAYRNFEKGCNKGNTRACYTLGIFHERGLHVKTDYEKAKQFYQKSCKRSLLTKFYDGCAVLDTWIEART